MINIIYATCEVQKKVQKKNVTRSTIASAFFLKYIKRKVDDDNNIIYYYSSTKHKY